MRIEINNKYIIRTDERNYTLSEIMVSEKGKNIGTEYYNDLGYYSTLRGALCGCLEKGIMKSDLTGVQDITEAIRVAKDEICQAVQDAVSRSNSFKDKPNGIG